MIMIALLNGLGRPNQSIIIVRPAEQMLSTLPDLPACRTVISIECAGGLCHAATIEHGEGEEEGEPVTSILCAFGKLGWRGVDENGEYSLVAMAG